MENRKPMGECVMEEALVLLGHLRCVQIAFQKRPSENRGSAH